jgi:hypothetical protein
LVAHVSFQFHQASEQISQGKISQAAGSPRNVMK